MKEIPISIEYLRECFDYDPLSGLLTWKHRPVKHFHAEQHQKAFNAKLAGKAAGCVHKGGYVEMRLCGTRMLVHRIAWALTYGAFPEKSIDHIDGDTTNNRIANLRLAETAENQWNAKLRVNNTSGYKGVHKRANKWAAYIAVKGKRISLGSFDTPEAAYAARCAAANDLHGEFANHGHSLTTQGANHGK